MQNSPLFSLEDISFSCRGKALLKNVNLALPFGQRIGILGKNGSGKSTLLHIGAGLIRPDAGRVLYKSGECSSEKDFAKARRGLGYLLQRAEDQLFCSTVLEDVAFGPYNLGYSPEESENMARRALEDMGLSRLADRNGQQLSGGEQKLAALASILVMGVDMLFLDEPTNDLDDDARALLFELLRRHDLPALIVSHDLPFLQKTCTRLYLLENGSLSESNRA